MQARNISETALTMTGSFGRFSSVTHSSSGHSVGSLVTTHAVAMTEWYSPSSRVMLISIVLEERNRGMKGIASPGRSSHSNVFSRGRKGSFAVRSCNGSRMSKIAGYVKAYILRFRTLRVYFRKLAHSAFVGIFLILNDFRTKS